MKKAKDLGALVEKGFISANENKALNELIAELKALWPGVEIKAFGSKVKGIADEESDLDILILLPCDAKENIRKKIIHRVFDLNLAHETNISPLIMSKSEWESTSFSFLPIHTYVEEEGVPI